SSLPIDRGRLSKIRDQAVAALDSGAELLHALRTVGPFERVRKLARDLTAIADRVAPELRDLGRKIDRSIERVQALGATLGEEGQSRLQRALASLRRAASLGERAIADARAIQSRIESGQGAIGAFLQDRELFDDLHDTHRILKSQPLRFI